MNKIKIIVDTREKHPFLFESYFPAVSVSFETLKTGDYSLKGHSVPGQKNSRGSFIPSICIERKSLEDLFLTLGNGRERFHRELERMVDYTFSAIVSEGSLSDMIESPPIMSSMHPNAVIGSLFSYCTRYGIHFFAASNRAEAEMITYHLLRRVAIDHRKGLL